MWTEKQRDLDWSMAQKAMNEGFGVRHDTWNADDNGLNVPTVLVQKAPNRYAVVYQPGRSIPSQGNYKIAISEQMSNKWVAVEWTE